VQLDPDFFLDVLDAEKHPLVPGGDNRRFYDGTLAGSQLELVLALSEHAAEHARSCPET
jgi:hypothetical protein